VAVGGSLGGLARYLISAAAPPGEHGFPWATLAINVAGSLLLGVLLAAAVHRGPPRRQLRSFLGTGVLGAFTTFSTFAEDVDRLGRGGRYGTAAAYAAATLVVGLVAAWSGLTVGRAFGNVGRS
jgi:CrcB protein